MYLIDTNVLMDFPQVIEDLCPIFITTDVLKELDGLKMSVNPDIAFKARRAAVVISRNLDKINWDEDGFPFVGSVEEGNYKKPSYDVELEGPAIKE